MITAREVYDAEFGRAAIGSTGYDEVSVDDFLDRVIATLTALEHGRPLPEHSVTSHEVVEVEFPERSAQASGGYDLDDVDDLLDRVAQRLFQAESENGAAQSRIGDGARDAAAVDGAAAFAGESAFGAEAADAGVRGEAWSGDDAWAADGADGGVADAEALAVASGAPRVDASQDDAPQADRASELMGAAEASDGGVADVQALAVPSGAPVGAEDHASELMGAAEAPVAGDGRSVGALFEGSDGHGANDLGANAIEADAIESRDEVPLTHAVEPDVAERDEVDGRVDGHGESDVEAGAINPVGAEPLDEDEHLQHDEQHHAAAVSDEPVHPVGSDPEVADHGVAQQGAERHSDVDQHDVDQHDVDQPDTEVGDAPRPATQDEGFREGDDASGRQGQPVEWTVVAVNPDEPIAEGHAGRLVERSEPASFVTGDERDAEGDDRESRDARDVHHSGEFTTDAAGFDAPAEGEPLRNDSIAPVTPARSMGQSWSEGLGGDQQASESVVPAVDDTPAPAVSEVPHVDVPATGDAPAVDVAVAPRVAATEPADLGFAPSTLPSPNVSLPDVASIDESVPESDIVSYPATDHRVPLPRNDVRRSVSDADRAAEAQYHPEFSAYATPDEPADAFASSVMPANEDAATSSFQGEPSTAGNPPAAVSAELEAREQERAAARERLDSANADSAQAGDDPADGAPERGGHADHAGAAGVVANVVSAVTHSNVVNAVAHSNVVSAVTHSNVVSAVANSSVVSAVQNAIGSNDTETKSMESSNSTSNGTQSDTAGIGRPEPIDAPEPLDAVTKPESIDAPKPLPARDDTSRKGILRRIFKG